MQYYDITCITIHEHTPSVPAAQSNTSMQPFEVLLYTRLYAAFLGLVSQPAPRGAFKPIEWRTNLFTEVRAAMRFLILGTRKPNFILTLPEWDAMLRARYPTAKYDVQVRAPLLLPLLQCVLHRHQKDSRT
jgi:hypothetical protein